MLFNNRLNLITENLSSITSEIDFLSQKIETLRTEKLALESHLQQLGSAENAAESAIEQARTAIAMIKAICPSELETFRQALGELFSQTIHEIAPAPEETQPEPEPEALENPPQTVEVEVIEEIPEPETETPPIETDGNGHHKNDDDLKSLLKKYHMTDLRKLAASHGLDATGKKDDLISRLVESGISSADI